MKVAIVGSRSLTVNNLEEYLPEGVDEIVSGGAAGIDSCARAYANAHGIKLTEFLPDYPRYGRRAPLVRNLDIVDYTDAVVAFWDEHSRGTKFVIDACIKKEKVVTVHRL